MKNIELTEDHKSKLLEMCNKLFPEYNFNIDKINTIIGIIKYQPEKEIISEIVINWFEFCVNYLSRKLYLKLDKRKHSHHLFNNTKGIIVYHEHSVFNNYYLYFEKEHHLIDYLYEVFKKTK